jgi:hypothetical protein
LVVTVQRVFEPSSDLKTSVPVVKLLTFPTRADIAPRTMSPNIEYISITVLKTPLAIFVTVSALTAAAAIASVAKAADVRDAATCSSLARMRAARSGEDTRGIPF